MVARNDKAGNPRLQSRLGFRVFCASITTTADPGVKGHRPRGLLKYTGVQQSAAGPQGLGFMVWV